MTDGRRRFNGRERTALYLAADGSCEECGEPLPVGWHADHDRPHSKGGLTAVSNGRALCPRCNLTKGDRVVYADTFQPREFQRKVITAALDGTASGRKVSVILASPGSGKTLAWQAAGSCLYREGQIDHVAVFAPRRILAQQSELTWMATDRDTGELVGDHLLFDPRGRLGAVRHVPNNPPLTAPGQHGTGFATTYSALAENSAIYKDWAERNGGRFLLVADEAQFCGARDERHAGTKAGALVEELSGLAAHTLLLTGTPYRADGARLILADYGEPDDKGVRRLSAHAEARYAEGVADGYLRPFEATMQEVHVRRRYLDNRAVEYDLSTDGSELAEVLRRADVWQGISDRVVTAVRNKQRVDPDYCGLVSCMEQGDAKRVAAYLTQKYPGLRVALSVSEDGPDAERVLRAFKATGKDGRRTSPSDVLVTVRKAFIGYDCPQITVVGILTNYRDPGHLSQLVGRGLRIWKKPEARGQSCLVVAPDDPRMDEFVELMLGLSQEGLRDRERREPPPDGGGGGDPIGELSWVEWANPTTARAVSPEAEVGDDELTLIESIRHELGMADDATKLAGFLEKYGLRQTSEAVAPTAPSPASGGGAPLTVQEQVDEVNARTADHIRKVLHAGGIHPQHPTYQAVAAKTTAAVNKAAGYKAGQCRDVEHAEARLRAALALQVPVS